MSSNKALNEAKKKLEGEYKLTKADYKEAKQRGTNKLDFKAMNKFKDEKAEKGKKEAEEKLKDEQEKLEAEKLANPTQGDLLKDIRDLLQAQANDKQTKASK